MIKVTVSRVTNDDAFEEHLVLTFFADGFDSGVVKLAPDGAQQIAAALLAAGITVHDLRETTEDHKEGETETDV